MAQSATGDTDLLGWLVTLQKTDGAALPAPATAAPTPRGIPAGSPPAGQFRPQEVLVTLTGTTGDLDQAIARDFALALQSSTPSVLLGTRVVRYRIPESRSVATVLAALGQDQRVAAAQATLVYRLNAAPSVLPQFMLDKVSATDAHQITRGQGAVVAVIDTGIDSTHPDLQGSVRARFDAVGDGGDDVGQHGTAIGGLIAAHGGASGGLTGMAPEASLLAVRAFPAKSGLDADSDTLILLRALDWCASQRAPIVNMSLTGPNDPLLAAAIASLIAQGSLVVAAAGNDGAEAPPAYPAALPGVLAVTATDTHDVVLDRANQGAYVGLAAPGVDVLVVRPGGGYDAATGTSMAAAVVSGSAALLLARAPGTPAADLRAGLLGSAVDLGPPGPDPVTGAGRLNAAAALAALPADQPLAVLEQP